MNARWFYCYLYSIGYYLLLNNIQLETLIWVVGLIKSCIVVDIADITCVITISLGSQQDWASKCINLDVFFFYRDTVSGLRKYRILNLIMFSQWNNGNVYLSSNNVIICNDLQEIMNNIRSWPRILLCMIHRCSVHHQLFEQSVYCPPKKKDPSTKKRIVKKGRIRFFISLLARKLWFVFVYIILKRS